jgi:hypothetical protein
MSQTIEHLMMAKQHQYCTYPQYWNPRAVADSRRGQERDVFCATSLAEFCKRCIVSDFDLLQIIFSLFRWSTNSKSDESDFVVLDKIFRLEKN